MAMTELTHRPQAAAMQQASHHGEIMASAAQAQAVAQVQAPYTVALNRPRNLDQFRVSLLARCDSPGFAEKARYRKPIGRGDFTEGLTIRFIESAVTLYGNAKLSSYMLYETAEFRVYTAVAIDLESNVIWDKAISVPKTVERSSIKPGQRVIAERVNSYGKPVYIVDATHDEIERTASAMISKALRELGKKIMPPEILEEAEARVIMTQNKKVKEDPAAARKLVVDSFVSLGVQPVDLEKYLGHPVAQCSPSQIIHLRELFTTLRNGEATWREVMEAQQGDDSDEQSDDKPKVTGKAANLAAKVKANGQG